MQRVLAVADRRHSVLDLVDRYSQRLQLAEKLRHQYLRLAAAHPSVVADKFHVIQETKLFT